MRLLNVDTLKLVDFIGQDIPPYVILSHCWRHGPDEILYEDVELSEPQTWQVKKKAAAAKVNKTCALAREIGFKHVWIDTCCIDKRSSAELTEAINSMFAWYMQAAVCFAFLDDVGGLDDLGQSRWFTRGWTLQELIAPDNVWFYNKTWTFTSDRFSIYERLSDITGIDRTILVPEYPFDQSIYYPPCSRLWPNRRTRLSRPREKSVSAISIALRSTSVARKMSWAAERKTTREEDTAYCLMGLFDVHMPLLYGEGTRAFTRLQEHIIQQVDDQSILAWVPTVYGFAVPLLAPSPAHFTPLGTRNGWWWPPPMEQSSIQLDVNREWLQVNVSLCRLSGMKWQGRAMYLAALDCALDDIQMARPALLLFKDNSSDDRFGRVRIGTTPQDLHILMPGSLPDRVICLAPKQTGWNHPLGSRYAHCQMRTSSDFDSCIDLAKYGQLEDGELNGRSFELKRIKLIEQRFGRRSWWGLGWPPKGPPLLMEEVVDCDPGGYTARNIRLCGMWSSLGGLVAYTKGQMLTPRFFVLWTANTSTEIGCCWCKVLPPDYRRLASHYAAAESMSDILKENILPKALRVKLWKDAESQVQSRVGRWRHKMRSVGHVITAEMKAEVFLGKRFMRLSIDVSPVQNHLVGLVV
ncbi:hypothetical protein GGS20DRAFT_535100 [Poronia punctata]|nr:hypothetical protein GGS20DRAFT_535100 [Poronia punctata]